MPAGMVRTQGGCGGSVGPRRYDHERGWSPFRPVQCLAAGVDESPEPTHRNSEPGVTIITRTRDNSNRKQTRYIAPIPPAVELRQIIGPHQPDEPPLGVSAAQIGRASCRGRVCQYGEISVVAGQFKKKRRRK